MHSALFIQQTTFKQHDLCSRRGGSERNMIKCIMPMMTTTFHRNLVSTQIVNGQNFSYHFVVKQSQNDSITKLHAGISMVQLSFIQLHLSLHIDRNPNLKQCFSELFDNGHRQQVQHQRLLYRSHMSVFQLCSQGSTISISPLGIILQCQTCCQLHFECISSKDDKAAVAISATAEFPVKTAVQK